MEQKQYAELQVGDICIFQPLAFGDTRRLEGIIMKVERDTLHGDRAAYTIQPLTDLEYEGEIIRYHPYHAEKPECDEIIFQDAVQQER